MLAYFLALRQSLLLRDPVIKYAFLGGALTNLLIWGLAVWATLARFAAKDFLILHSTVYFGIDLVGPKYRIYFYPLLGLTILLGNVAMVIIWGKRDVFLARNSSWITVGLEVMIFAACVFMVRLNSQ